jgi:hypothetical protein
VSALASAARRVCGQRQGPRGAPRTAGRSPRRSRTAASRRVPPPRGPCGLGGPGRGARRGSQGKLAQRDRRDQHHARQFRRIVQLERGDYVGVHGCFHRMSCPMVCGRSAARDRLHRRWIVSPPRDRSWVPRSFRSHMPRRAIEPLDEPSQEPSRKSARRLDRNRISSKVTLHPSPVGDWPSKPILSRDVSSSRTNTRIICQAVPSSEAW